MMLNTLLVVFLSCLPTPLVPQQPEKSPTFSALFQSGMVIQRSALVPLFGTAEPGTSLSLSVSWDGTIYTSVADPAGRFLLRVKSPAEAGPHELVLRGGGSVITLKDVLAGEVWLCSGQSNMEWTITALASAPGMDKVIALAANPRIRHFDVANTIAPSPRSEAKGTWVAATPETIGSFSAVAYFFAHALERELQAPIGLVNATWGGTPAEAWMPSSSLAAFPEFGQALQRLADDGVKDGEEKKPISPGNPSVLWNGMIAPLVPAKFRGVIWYQGESNVGRGPQYLKLFPALITEWRRVFEDELAFGFVQIAPFGYQKDEGKSGEVRDAQRRALHLPKTGMASTMDVGNPVDIHPVKKREVGDRLARWALVSVYQRTMKDWACPQPERVVTEGDVLRLSFRHAESGLRFAGDTSALFEIRNDEGAWKPASATLDGSSVLLAHPEVATPKHARYGWKASAEGDAFSGDQPLPCFNTAEWWVK